MWLESVTRWVCGGGMALLLAGCHPGFRIVRTAELEGLEQQARAGQVQVAMLLEEQAALRQALQRSREEILPLVQGLKDWSERPPAPVECLLPEDSTPACSLSDHEGQSLPAVSSSDKKVIGAVEDVLVRPPGIILPARIDTGAATSSLDARNLQRFERDGKPWVRFEVQMPESGQKAQLERPIVRQVRIVQAGRAEGERRPVVELQITLGGMVQTAQFTLSSRTHLEYPLLIGRNVLRDVMVVDVGRKRSVRPRTGEAAP